MSSWNRAGLGSAMMLVQMMAAACSSQMEPARRSLGEIQATIGAAAAAAASDAPDRLAAVQGQLGVLEQAFDRQDYAAVTSAAPAVLRAAQALPGEAAAAKADRRRALGDEWSALAAALPGRIGAIQHRIDILAAGTRAQRPRPAGAPPVPAADLEAARADLTAAESLWSKAQAAFATGNLDEAVATARSVGTKVDAAAGGLRLAPEGPG